MSLRRLIAWLATLLVGWLGLFPPGAAVAAPSFVPTAYAYTSLAILATDDDSCTEPGPPTNDPFSPGAVDRWSHGASACAGGPTPRVATTYDDPIKLVQVENATGTTPEQAQDVDGALSRLAPSDVAAKGAPTVHVTERLASNPVKPTEALDRWNDFLGPGPHTNIHPRTGVADPNRIVSADGRRSIRFGQQEMNSSPTKFHYHEETWSFDPSANAWQVDNLLVRVPFPKGAW